MPKIVDYAARFEFLRDAAFHAVLQSGPESLSLRRLTDELGCTMGAVRGVLDASSSLPVLAADAVRARWRSEEWRRPSPGRDAPAFDRAVHLATLLLPADASEAAEHLVWFKLLASCRSVIDRLEGSDDEPLPVRFQVAQRGWADETLPAPPHREPDPALESHASEHAAHETELLARALSLVEADPAQLPSLRALVHGLAWDVCLGHVSADDAAAILHGHLARVTT